ncbi:MAG: hypothetical protein LBT59_20110 [Clostridiales bacterium]|jgi:transposase|nr:hypothetical protein [Clostridiales bacterium]
MSNEVMMFALFYPEYQVTDETIEDGKIVVKMNSLKTADNCPVCGVESVTLHEDSIRTIQEAPCWNTGVWIRAKIHTFKCQNQDCPVDVFSEELSFAGQNKTYTYRLEKLLQDFRTKYGNEKAKYVLAVMGADLSDFS